MNTLMNTFSLGLLGQSLRFGCLSGKPGFRCNHLNRQMVAIDAQHRLGGDRLQLTTNVLLTWCFLMKKVWMMSTLAWLLRIINLICSQKKTPLFTKKHQPEYTANDPGLCHSFPKAELKHFPAREWISHSQLGRGNSKPCSYPLDLSPKKTESPKKHLERKMSCWREQPSCLDPARSVNLKRQRVKGASAFWSGSHVACNRKYSESLLLGNWQNGQTYKMGTTYQVTPFHWLHKPRTNNQTASIRQTVRKPPFFLKPGRSFPHHRYVPQEVPKSVEPRQSGSAQHHERWSQRSKPRLCRCPPAPSGSERGSCCFLQVLYSTCHNSAWWPGQ